MRRLPMSSEVLASAGGTERISTEEINQLIFRREQARQQKDWVAADVLRDHLQVAAGVTIWDKRGIWNSIDGRTGRIPNFAQVEAGMRVGASIAVEYPGGQAEAWIRRQVQLREQARASKNFKEADRLRDELKAHGVEVWDKEKIWRSQSAGLQGCVLGYGQADKGPTNVEIMTLIVEREKARQVNDYAKSDMIREDLKRAGVIVLDKAKTWKASDGRSGVVPSFSDIQATGGQPAIDTNVIAEPDAIKAGSGVEELQEKIFQAAVLCVQNPAMAQQTLKMLSDLVTAGPPGVEAERPALFKATKVAAGGGEQFANNPSSSLWMQPPREALQFALNWHQGHEDLRDGDIQWLVETRERLRAKKDFAGSDVLRDALKSKMHVDLLEKEKRWIGPDGRCGVIPSWDSLGIPRAC
eukprot:TRINITY_DN120722_c0_g1_i1.p1 TRINITY_DN120722_c0_g1~~TRINITY_DN120722_c0_g1_i1.p1  ORF type:complete len:412 (+),score=87.59 TRINITY_DN120722_c0_g1_i1:67-1302(+)